MMDYEDEIAKILNGRNKPKPPPLPEIFGALAEIAEKHKISYTITTNPDGGQEITVSPWEPYQPICPYARQRRAEEDDGR